MCDTVLPSRTIYVESYITAYVVMCIHVTIPSLDIDVRSS